MLKIHRLPSPFKMRYLWKILSVRLIEISEYLDINPLTYLEAKNFAWSLLDSFGCSSFHNLYYYRKVALHAWLVWYLLSSFLSNCNYLYPNNNLITGWRSWKVGSNLNQFRGRALVLYWNCFYIYWGCLEAELG